MSESFSDPSRLNGVEISGDPLADYYDVANQTYSGEYALPKLRRWHSEHRI